MEKSTSNRKKTTKVSQGKKSTGKTSKTLQAKIFVIDTSVILYNHMAILSFEDNDVAIPITVLEELDRFKKGNDIKNFEARSLPVSWISFRNLRPYRTGCRWAMKKVVI